MPVCSLFAHPQKRIEFPLQSNPGEVLHTGARFGVVIMRHFITQPREQPELLCYVVLPK
ncbi:MAG: hypothetical protein ACOX17_03790 [Christensenellales bacterium]